MLEEILKQAIEKIDACKTMVELQELKDALSLSDNSTLSNYKISKLAFAPIEMQTQIQDALEKRERILKRNQISIGKSLNPDHLKTIQTIGKNFQTIGKNFQTSIKPFEPTAKAINDGLKNWKKNHELEIRNLFNNIESGSKQIASYANAIQEMLYGAVRKIDSSNTMRQLQNTKVELLGKSSPINQEMNKLVSASPEEKKSLGQIINKSKDYIHDAINDQTNIVQHLELATRFESEKIDMTIPARSRMAGSIHPITQCMEELIQVFSKYGFDIKDGPSIEDDWYNFTALNIDENHPARQMHDTFYLNKTDEKTKLLRTHTSPIQIRTMQNQKPPYRFIAPGRTYRSDSDQTHTPMFHQIEGMVIDRNIHMGHLKYIIIDFIRSFFEQPNIEVQFRPSFFPFTEPSAEVDIKMNKGDKWLEVLGCGMVHPNVLKNVGIDPNKYQGFAFGLGVERFAMLKYGIKDLRQMFEGDIRWLNHYNFKGLDIPSFAGGLTR